MMTAAFSFGAVMSAGMMSQIHEPREVCGRMRPRGDQDAMF